VQTLRMQHASVKSFSLYRRSVVFSLFPTVTFGDGGNIDTVCGLVIFAKVAAEFILCTGHRTMIRRD